MEPPAHKAKELYRSTGEPMRRCTRLLLHSLHLPIYREFAIYDLGDIFSTG